MMYKDGHTIKPIRWLHSKDGHNMPQYIDMVQTIHTHVAHNTYTCCTQYIYIYILTVEVVSGFDAFRFIY